MGKISDHPILVFVRKAIDSSKWLLIVFYTGLIYAQALYAIRFVAELAERTSNFMFLSSTDFLMVIFEIVDIVMIASLVKTILSGSYHAFLDKGGPVSEHISSGYLKVKMSMSIVGISGIHLLQTFINIEHENTRDLIAKAAFHLVFLISAWIMAHIEYLHEKSKTVGSHD